MLRTCLSSLRSRSPAIASRRDVANFDPPYLSLLKPALPVHEDLVNIQLKGYDFAVLEQQTRKLQKIINLLDLEIKESWATPFVALDIQTYLPFSVSIDKQYKLKIYERNIQIEKFRGAKMPLLLDLIQKNLAAGITVSVHKHLPEHTEIRHIPDLELEALEKQLEEMNPGRKWIQHLDYSLEWNCDVSFSTLYTFLVVNTVEVMNDRAAVL